MGDDFDPCWLLMAAPPFLVLAGLVFDLDRARRWERMLRARGSLLPRGGILVGPPPVAAVHPSDALGLGPRTGGPES